MSTLVAEDMPYSWHKSYLFAVMLSCHTVLQAKLAQLKEGGADEDEE